MVIGFIQSLIKLCGLDWTAPDYTTPYRRQKHINIAISYQKGSVGLRLLTSSTGLKFLGDKLTARSFSSQVNEIYARVAVLNTLTKLDCPHTQVVS